MSNLQNDTLLDQIHEIVFNHPEYFKTADIQVLNDLVVAGDIQTALDFVETTLSINDICNICHEQMTANCNGANCKEDNCGW